MLHPDFEVALRGGRWYGTGAHLLLLVAATAAAVLPTLLDGLARTWHPSLYRGYRAGPATMGSAARGAGAGGNDLIAAFTGGIPLPGSSSSSSSSTTPALDAMLRTRELATQRQQQQRRQRQSEGDVVSAEGAASAVANHTPSSSSTSTPGGAGAMPRPHKGGSTDGPSSSAAVPQEAQPETPTIPLDLPEGPTPPLFDPSAAGVSATNQKDDDDADADDPQSSAALPIHAPWKALWLWALTLAGYALLAQLLPWLVPLPALAYAPYLAAAHLAVSAATAVVQTAMLAVNMAQVGAGLTT
jgi:hypothetical protein